MQVPSRFRRVTARGLARPSKSPRVQAQVGVAHYAAHVNADVALAIYSDSPPRVSPTGLMAGGALTHFSASRLANTPT